MKTLPYLFKKPLKTLSLFSLLCFLLFTNMKCKKYFPEPGPETLPAETQTGTRTFGCLVDGKVWLPKGNFPYSSLSTTIQYDILNLQARRGNEGINISISKLTSTGDYDLTQSKNFIVYAVNDVLYQCTQGSLTITRYDKTNKILSGRFSFIGQDTVSKKTVSVTDGRLDVTFTN
ncbi:MAG: DUF6252 family protein [Mucilaginibacter sp.]|uniref:DUF6252 family protein n=1 Tax=Mucilaginibacter sp. TaxID=1882438 RepID=UPI0034E4A159